MAADENASADNDRNIFLLGICFLLGWMFVIMLCAAPQLFRDLISRYIFKCCRSENGLTEKNEAKNTQERISKFLVDPMAVKPSSIIVGHVMGSRNFAEAHVLIGSIPEMGHGHHEPFEVPHYSKFNNWQASPQLAEYNARLARLGLKDPWIRNLLHYYDPKTPMYTTKFSLLKKVMRHGLVPGLSIAAGVIAIEEAYSYVKHGHTSWGGH